MGIVPMFATLLYSGIESEQDNVDDINNILDSRNDGV